MFDVMVHIISVFLLVIVLYPMILVVSNSLSDPGLVASGKVLFLPKGLNFNGYVEFFQDKNILIGYANTLFYTVAGTIINLLVTVPAGYALTKKTLPGNGIFMTMFMIIMYFSGGMIPTFLVANKLGLYNTRWVLLILGAFNTYNCIICKSFFAAMPKDMEEAAEIDGCSPMKTFIQIILPLSKALLGVMVLYFAVAHWNSYFNALMYVTDSSKMPLQLYLREILVLSSSLANSFDIDPELQEQMQHMSMIIKYSMIVVSTAPILCVYPFIQKYFVKGVMIGSVKG